MLKLILAMSLFVAACGATPAATTAPSAREARLVQERDAALAREQAALAREQAALARLTEAPPPQRRQANEPTKREAKRPLDDRKTYAVPLGDVPIIGPSTALVTMIRAYEYACPFSERSRATMERLKARYGADLRIVYKPLVVHPKQATGAALAACAAHKQGKFAQMDAMLWEQGFKPRNFDTSDDCMYAGTCPIAVSFAKRLGLNVQRFKADMRIACYDQLRTEQAMLKGYGVEGTPAFFINGRHLSGALSDDKFIEIIDEELAKARAALLTGVAAEDYYTEVIIGKGER